MDSQTGTSFDTSEETPEKPWDILSPEVHAIVRASASVTRCCGRSSTAPYPKAGNVVPDPWNDAFSSSQVPEDLRMHYGITSRSTHRHGRSPRPRRRQAPEPGAFGGSGSAIPCRPVTAGERAAFRAAGGTGRDPLPPPRLRSENPGFRQRGFLADGRVDGANRGAEGPPERRSPGGAAASVRRGARGDLPVPRPEDRIPPFLSRGENLTFDFVTGSTTGTGSGAPCWAPRSARSSAPSRRG